MFQISDANKKIKIFAFDIKRSDIIATSIRVAV